jgi:thiol-disulfide isomerase/thioredoxin
MKKLLLALSLITLSIAANSQAIKKYKITDIEKYIATSKDTVLVINFWATFCKPCVAEIPSFIKVTDQYKNNGVKLLLVSLDLPAFYPAKIQTFAKAHNFTPTIVWLDETNADYFCPKIDPKWSGSIPATLIINKRTGYRKFFEEEMEEGKFEAALKEAMEDK